MKNFKSITEYHEHLINNIDLVISEKKATIKQADPFMFVGDEFKQEKSIVSTTDATKIKVKAIINTTNLYDSHQDVHIKGLWKKIATRKKKNISFTRTFNEI